MSEALSIHHDQAGHQFETNVDGHRAYLTYMDLGKQTLDIYRTFVPNALRGRGIAAALTTGFLVQAFGWRAAFAVPGLACIALGFAFAALVPAEAYSLSCTTS